MRLLGPFLLCCLLGVSDGDIFQSLFGGGGDGGGQEFQVQFGGDDDGNDVFSQLFGGGRQRRGRSAKQDLEVELADLYNGKDFHLEIQRQAVCSHCRGSGAKDEKSIKHCPSCKGKGHVIQEVQLAPGFVQQMQTHCPKCGGQGKIVAHKCPVCHGNKVVQEHKKESVRLERGIPNGHKLVIKGVADESPGLPAGDLILTINPRHHPVFQRDGNDLRMSMDITLLESLVGFSRTVKQLDGRDITVARNSVTQHGLTDIIKNEGMPKEGTNGKSFGNLHVTYNVKFPSVLTTTQRDGFAAMFPAEAARIKAETERLESSEDSGSEYGEDEDDESIYGSLNLGEGEDVGERH